MTRKEILQFYKGIIDGISINDTPVKATNYLFSAKEVDDYSHYFYVVSNRENISIGLNGEMLDRRMTVVIGGYAISPKPEYLFETAEDVVDAIVDKIVDRSLYTSCAFGPAAIDIAIEASDEIDRLANISISVLIEWLD